MVPIIHNTRTIIYKQEQCLNNLNNWNKDQGTDPIITLTYHEVNDKSNFLFCGKGKRG